MNQKTCNNSMTQLHLASYAEKNKRKEEEPVSLIFFISDGHLHWGKENQAGAETVKKISDLCLPKNEVNSEASVVKFRRCLCKCHYSVCQSLSKIGAVCLKVSFCSTAEAACSPTAQSM